MDKYELINTNGVCKFFSIDNYVHCRLKGNWCGFILGMIRRQAIGVLENWQDKESFLVDMGSLITRKELWMSHLIQICKLFHDHPSYWEDLKETYQLKMVSRMKVPHNILHQQFVFHPYNHPMAWSMGNGMGLNKCYLILCPNQASIDLDPLQNKPIVLEQMQAWSLLQFSCFSHHPLNL